MDQLSWWDHSRLMQERGRIRIWVRNEEVHHNKQSSWCNETVFIRYISPFPCLGQYFGSTTGNEKDDMHCSSKSVSSYLCGINDKKLTVFPGSLFKADFGECTLLSQAGTCHYHETQVLLPEKTAESIQGKSAGRNRKTAAQESHICADSYHKT